MNQINFIEFNKLKEEYNVMKASHDILYEEYKVLADEWLDLLRKHDKIAKIIGRDFYPDKHDMMAEKYDIVEKNNKLLDEIEIKMVAQLVIDLSGKYAYYFCGTMDLENKYVHRWLYTTLDSIKEPITFVEWLDKFIEGTLTDTHIEELYERFHEMNECGSIFTHMKITKEDNISKRIEETKELMYKFIEEDREERAIMKRFRDDIDDGYDVSDEIVSNEALCHFYLKIGKYFIFGINLDGPFKTFQFLTNQKKII